MAEMKPGDTDKTVDMGLDASIADLSLLAWGLTSEIHYKNHEGTLDECLVVQCVHVRRVHERLVKSGHLRFEESSG